MEAIQSKSPTIVTIKLEYGETAAKAFIVKLLQGLIAFFNVGKSMNDFQVADTARLIMQQYYYLKLEDFKVCFDGVKAGKYLSHANGKLYDRLDGQTILLCLGEYTEERATTAETISIEKHKEIRDAENEKRYIIKVGVNYLVSEGDDFSEVTERALATAYTYEQAIRHKTWLIKFHFQNEPQLVVIQDAKVDYAFYDWLKKERPDLVVKDYDKSVERNYNIEVAKINANPNLSDFERCNQIRALTGLLPLTELEFENRK